MYMPKSKKMTKKQKKTTRNNSRKVMRGGDLNQTVIEQLSDNKFSMSQIDRLKSKNVSVDNINNGIDFYNNNAPELITGIVINLDSNLQPLDPSNFIDSNFINKSVQNPVTPSVDNNNDANYENQQNAISMSDDKTIDQTNLPQNQSEPPNTVVSPDSTSVEPPNSTPDSNMSITDPNAPTPDSNMSTPDSNASPVNPNAPQTPITGGKKSKKRLYLKRKNRKSLKGGKLYGTGYGANCTDPNYSVYNTNLKTLFPYKPK